MKFVHKACWQSRATAGHTEHWPVRRRVALFVAVLALQAHMQVAVAAEMNVDGRPASRHAAEERPYAVTAPHAGEFRFEVRAGDRWSVDRILGADRERAELSLDKSPVSFGALYRVSYEMLIEPGPQITSAWLVAGQWHATEDEGDAPSSPPLAFELAGRDLVVYTQSETARHHARNPEGMERARVENIPRGRWVRVSYDVRFDPRHGTLAVRVDGRRVFAEDIPIGYADDVGPYFKFGIYRAKSPEPIAIRYRNVTITEAKAP